MNNDVLTYKAKEAKKALETIGDIKFRQDSFSDLWIPFTSIFWREYDAIEEFIDEVLKENKQK